MKIRNPWKEPSALALAVRQLEDAQRSLLEHSAQAEYYASTRDMLTKRILRLKEDIDRLKSES
jgi:RNA-splicing ligase RtcB